MKHLTSVMSTLAHIVAGFMLVLVLANIISSIGIVSTHAQFQKNEGACEIKRKITMADILAPAQFFPVIPAECSTDDQGRANPLSLAVLPDVAIRFFGALVSLVFYLFFFIAVFSGIQWIYGGIEERQALQAKRNFQDSFIGLVITLATYLVINTIVGSVLRVNFRYTDMDQFFTL